MYAVKHNPFAYFANIQAGADPENSLENIVGFERLYADLKRGHVPNFFFIVPNQRHDQHGRGASEVGPGCSTDAGTIAQGLEAGFRLKYLNHAADQNVNLITDLFN